MNMLNSIILEGNITRQPELKDFSNGGKVCTLPIAVNRRYKAADGTSQEEVSYFDIDTFGNLADVCSKWCPKGRGVRVVGRLKQNRWTDSDGKAHSRVKVIAEHIEFKPYFKKEGENNTPSDEKEGPTSVFAGDPPATKKQKLAMLAEAAAAAEKEQENGEVAF